MAYPLAGKFIVTMLHSVTNAHLAHLKTGSFSQHKALEEFYSEIGDIVDSYAESYFGGLEFIEEYPTSVIIIAGTPLEYMITLKKYVETTRKELPQDSYLQNIIDEMMALITRTIYKLERLK